MEKSGRFAGIAWEKSASIEVSTLDEAIKQYGKPRFIKIDVEGFEEAVLEGLTEGVEANSFEFLAEDLDRARRCIASIQGFGEHEFNVVCGESFRLESSEWLSATEVMDYIATQSARVPGGDIYARICHGL
jgi:hypothetical protein